jgi:hypothetical protein
VAPQAKRAHVGQVAFSAAFGHRHDMIGVPQVPAMAPILLELAAGVIVELAFVLAQRFGVRSALRANAAVAQKDLFAQVARVGTEFPIVHACHRAECEAAFGDFCAAPAAAVAALHAAIDPTSGLCAADAHKRKS